MLFLSRASILNSPLLARYRLYPALKPAQSFCTDSGFLEEFRFVSLSSPDECRGLSNLIFKMWYSVAVEFATSVTCKWHIWSNSFKYTWDLLSAVDAYELPLYGFSNLSLIVCKKAYACIIGCVYFSYRILLLRVNTRMGVSVFRWLWWQSAQCILCNKSGGEGGGVGEEQLNKNCEVDWFFWLLLGYLDVCSKSKFSICACCCKACVEKLHPTH